jgi:hypothetical protein
MKIMEVMSSLSRDILAMTCRGFKKRIKAKVVRK